MPSVYASTRKASHIGAEQKNLCPVSRYSAPVPVRAPDGTATVELARTSEPPCFSVMNMPTMAPDFSGAGMSRRS